MNWWWNKKRPKNAETATTKRSEENPCADEEERRMEESLPHRKQVGAILGWRSWRVGEDRAGIRLWSTNLDVPWDGPVMRADEPPEVTFQYAAYGSYGSHGIYAWGRLLVGTGYDELAIQGEIELFGRVVVQERGYRAEAARIKRIFVYPGKWYDTWARAIESYNEYIKARAPSRYVSPGTFAEPFGRGYAADKDGVVDRNLIVALENRYQCEVLAGTFPTTQENGAVGLAAPTIITPTAEQIKWISEHHKKS